MPRIVLAFGLVALQALLARASPAPKPQPVALPTPTQAASLETALKGPEWGEGEQPVITILPAPGRARPEDCQYASQSLFRTVASYLAAVSKSRETRLVYDRNKPTATIIAGPCFTRGGNWYDDIVPGIYKQALKGPVAVVGSGRQSPASNPRPNSTIRPGTWQNPAQDRPQTPYPQNQYPQQQRPYPQGQIVQQQSPYPQDQFPRQQGPYRPGPSSQDVYPVTGPLIDQNGVLWSPFPGSQNPGPEQQPRQPPRAQGPRPNAGNVFTTMTRRKPTNGASAAPRNTGIALPLPGAPWDRPSGSNPVRPGVPSTRSTRASRSSSRTSNTPTASPSSMTASASSTESIAPGALDASSQSIAPDAVTTAGVPSLPPFGTVPLVEAGPGPVNAAPPPVLASTSLSSASNAPAKDLSSISPASPTISTASSTISRPPALQRSTGQMSKATVIAGTPRITPGPPPISPVDASNGWITNPAIAQASPRMGGG